MLEDQGLSPKEAKEIIRNLNAAAKRSGVKARASVILKRMAKEEAARLREQASRKKLNARRDAIKESELLTEIDQAKNRYDQIDGFYTGSNKFRASVAAEQKWKRNDWMGGLTLELKTEIHGFFRLARSKAFQNDVWDELYGDLVQSVTGNEDAFKFVKIADKHSKLGLQHARDAGAPISEIPVYGIHQIHDPRRMLKAGEEQWLRDLLPGLDQERTFGVNDPNKFVKNSFDNITTGTKSEGDAVGGGMSLANRLARRRVFFFKNAEEAKKYNAKYGVDDPIASIFNSHASLAEDVALMERMGTNPDAMHKKIIKTFERDILKERGPERKLLGKRVLNWMDPISALNNRYAAISKASSIPANANIAHWTQGGRNFIHTTKMNNVVITAFADLPFRIANAQTNGIGIFSGYAQMLKQFTEGPRTPAKDEILRGLAVAMDGTLNTIHSRVGMGGDVPGAMSKAANLMFKLNLLTPWTDFNDAGHGFMLSHNLAENAGKRFDDLEPLLRETLGMYRIKAEDWDAMRKAVATIEGGQSFITTETIRAHPDIQNKEALAKMLGTYFVNETDIGVPKPGAKERAIMLGGAQPGTVYGEMARFMLMYKTFSITMLSKVIPNALRAGVPGFIHLAVMSTIVGYMSHSIKQLLAGKTPLDPLSVKAAEAGMLQGGGMGFLGDVLLNDFNQYGRSFQDFAMGPGAGVVGDVFKIGSGLARGEDKSAQAFRAVMGNTPFINLFYTRQAIDYLFTHHVQEMLNPGYLRRYEQRVKSENDQSFWLPPSDTIAVGGGFR
ncbi:hypothetical protein LCGC14_0557430 [marine sediment metagenome]|uniref:Uncharacterized protein n=1 Tax=marine sediment metagenome TaxID=412755 RepID=A0A0F9S6N8_9ZZZZ